MRCFLRVLVALFVAYMVIVPTASAAGGNPPAQAIPIASMKATISPGSSTVLELKPIQPTVPQPVRTPVQQVVVEEIPQTETRLEMVEVVPHLKNDHGWFDPMEIDVAFGQNGKNSIGIRTEQRNALVLTTTGVKGDTDIAIASLTDLVTFSYSSQEIDGFYLSYYAGSTSQDRRQNWFFTGDWPLGKQGPTLKFTKHVGWLEIAITNTTGRDLWYLNQWGQSWARLPAGYNAYVTDDLFGSIEFAQVDQQGQLAFIGEAFWNWERLMNRPQITSIEPAVVHPGDWVTIRGSGLVDPEVSLDRVMLIYWAQQTGGGGVIATPYYGYNWDEDAITVRIPYWFVPQTAALEVIVGQKYSNQVVITVQPRPSVVAANCVLTRTAESQCR